MCANLRPLGGLGLRKCRFNNQALVTKLEWGMINEDKPLRVKVLRNKYKVTQNPRNWTLKSSPSSIWKSIHSAKNMLTKGVKWTVGNGQKINVWKDNWVGNVSFVNIMGIEAYDLPDLKVESIINSDRE